MLRALSSFSILFLFLFASYASAQDLLQERIRKIDDRKRSVYIDQGIFHNGSGGPTSTVKAVRHGLSDGYERVVFDFTTNEVPRIYAHLAKEERKLYLDLFKTDISDSVDSFGDSKHVESINFFPIETGDISVELIFKESADIEVFYLENHGRLIIDIKS